MTSPNLNLKPTFKRDEFGVLTEQYGLKPQGKSAPMAASKQPTSANDTQFWNFVADSNSSSVSAVPYKPSPSSASANNGSFGSCPPSC
ncbi:hypothetical protein L3X38_024192 [Prunus dulcis]|uniref:Uncharacterized protein n=1 Tax=Prunus dulcis TaxID=3755 RepID=A0AAD4Z695_PRUDU|nr:hypothetical protein L3X38_024192 [Prunus dulcis]